jgi:predicted  nucleic acid-binding Zn-ribbon protein
MSDAASDPATDDARAAADALVDELTDARDSLQRARDRVDAVGEDDLRAVADTYEDLTRLFDRYEEAVTGDGDFQTFIEFQGKIAAVTEELPEDVRRRDVFERVDDRLQQRRLTESDWQKVRSALEPVRDDVDQLEARDEARRRYEDARFTARRRIEALDDRIADLDDLQRLGDADLEAPTERLRDPIEAYNDRVRDAFDEFHRSASARDCLDFVAKTRAYPLVRFEPPPDALHEYVETHEAGEEPTDRLLEYAAYSKSKLDHYVADPEALKRNVSTRRTYLRRLDAEPLTVNWPPPAAETLRFRVRELTSVVARFADDVKGGDAVLIALRNVRELPRETDYQRLRDSAQARAQLGVEERERLASGEVEAELAACWDAKAQLEDALAEYPAL